MALSLGSRFKRAFNVFMNKDPTYEYLTALGCGYSLRPDRPRLTRGNNRTIISSIYNRIAVDVSQIGIVHCRLDNNDRFLEVIPSSLNECLTTEANIDQSGRAFIQDVALSMFDEGVIVILPVDTDADTKNGAFKILTMRTGKILQWYPEHVRILAYNDRTGLKEEITLPKKSVAIVENPFYAVMNEPNSTAQRLSRKLSLIDIADEKNASDKLNLILQFPYLTKGQSRQDYATRRLNEIEDQLLNSRLGIAYTDGTEKIIQLNRPLENNLMGQIEYLTNQLFSQLSITQSILDGTADDKTMLNYHTRTVEPVVTAIADAMKRSFLTKTARTEKQTIMYFRDPFKLVPVNDIAEIADKFTRNEIMTSNEIRQKIGMKPSTDPKADELSNSNIKKPTTSVMKTEKETIAEEEQNHGENLS